MTVNKIWIFSDTHFGIRSNSLEWVKNIEDYFNNWFIPLIKKNKKEGDILIHCGDLFDNRQHLSLLVINKVLDIFKQLSEIIPIYIILGNHDIFNKSTNDVNSVKILTYIPNITVIQEPKVLQLDNGKTLFFLPWRANPEEERKEILANNSNYLFCHLDINMFKYNAYTNVTSSIIDDDLFANYDRVFNGHLHYRQEKKNIILVGSSQQYTRGDIGNDKGVYILNPSNNTIKFIKNDYSPKFIKIRLENLLEKTLEEYQELVYNNYVDILVSSKLSETFPFNSLLESVKDFKKIDIVIDNQDNYSEIIDQIGEENNLVNFDIIKFSKLYIDKLNYSDKLKDLLNNKIVELYNKVTK